jgi:threonine/homoserine/homoserine lactone efflux protein
LVINGMALDHRRSELLEARRNAMRGKGVCADRSTVSEHRKISLLPSFNTYVMFVTALLAMQLVPGPETMLVISRGMGQGWLAAFWTVVGMTLIAGAIQLPLLVLGIAAAVKSLHLFDLLRLIGALYLIVLGVRLLRNGVGIAFTESPSQVSRLHAMREGAIANLTNPNPMLFMLAFLPQFVEPARGAVAMQLMVLGMTQKVIGFAVLICTALVSGVIGQWINSHPQGIVWQGRFAGAAIIAIGVYLLLY